MEMTMSFRLDEESFNRLDELCRILDLNKSSVIRHIIKKFDVSKIVYSVLRWDEHCNTYIEFVKCSFMGYVFEISRSMPDTLFMMIKYVEGEPIDAMQIKAGKEIEVIHSIYE